MNDDFSPKTRKEQKGNGKTKNDKNVYNQKTVRIKMNLQEMREKRTNIAKRKWRATLLMQCLVKVKEQFVVETTVTETRYKMDCKSFDEPIKHQINAHVPNTAWTIRLNEEQRTCLWNGRRMSWKFIFSCNHECMCYLVLLSFNYEVFICILTCCKTPISYSKTISLLLLQSQQSNNSTVF